jgi:hypothetical protein
LLTLNLSGNILAFLDRTGFARISVSQEKSP